MIHETITQSQARHVLRYVNVLKWLETDMRVMDIGCGNGYGTAIIKRKCADTIGHDVDDVALTQAVQTYPKIRFVHMDLLGLFPNARAEVIVCLETIEHFKPEDAATILKNFHGGIYDGGFLVLSTPYCEQSGPSPVNNEHLFEYSLTDLEQLLQAGGFDVEVMETERHLGLHGRLGYVMVKANKRDKR